MQTVTEKYHAAASLLRAAFHAVQAAAAAKEGHDRAGEPTPPWPFPPRLHLDAEHGRKQLDDLTAGGYPPAL